MNPAAATSAYTQAARLAAGPQDSAKAAAPGDPGAFSDLVMEAMGSVADSGQAVEGKAAALATGKADVVDLVTAVAETELALETLVTVRDRVISAYQDILNMPI